MVKTGIAGIALLVALAALTTGCGVPAVHPLYTDADLVAQPEIVGMWVDTGSTAGETWKFFKKPEVNAYTLIYTADGVPARFDAHFTRIGDAVYMDTWPISANEGKQSKDKKATEEANLLTQMHIIGAHLFWRIELKEPVLRMAMLDPDKLKQQLDAGTVSVAHEYQESPTGEEPTLILTAPTAQLREFVLKSAGRVFDDEPMELRRKTVRPAASPSN